MERKDSGRNQELFIWHDDSLREYTPIEARLPVVENSMTQVAPGPYHYSSTIVSNSEVTVVHIHNTSNSVGFLRLKPGLTGFYVPLRWAGDLKINSVMATPTAIHLPADEVALSFEQCERGPRLRLQTTRYIDDLLRVHYPLNRDQIVNLRGDKDVDGQRLCPPQTGGDPIPGHLSA
jgi:hypothetical protein